MAFTKEQNEAIDRVGSNIIVSAGAGSGKTAVLTERVIRKLKNGIDIDKLLILTFTREAANEMKERIRKSIIENKLDRQLSLIDSAYITTFDSFSLSIVKKYHYLLNINKNIKVADENIIKIYKYKALDEIFLSMYGNNEFDSLINDYTVKDDKNIKDFILDLLNKLDLLIDKETYLDNYLDTYYSEDFISKMLNNYLSLIRTKINNLEELYEKFTSYISDSLTIKLDEWFKPLFHGNTYDDYKIFLTYPTPVFKGVEENGIILKDDIKEKVKEISNYLRFNDTEDIIVTYKSTYNHVSKIIEIVKILNSRVISYKEENELYNFNDIAHMAIKVIKENEDIREELKNYFNEIMVDEYQDTSNIQEEFISLINNNNVYMVGDIKQSIYRFRNANPLIFKNKYDKYSSNLGGIKIDLLKNFRSRKETLSNINEIFNLIMDEEIGNANYIETHNMIYGNTSYDEEDTGCNNNLEIYNYNMEDKKYAPYEKELFIISDDIKDKIKNKYQVFDKDTKKLRDLKYSDICIITDRNAYLDTYKKILEYNGIPSVLYKDEEISNNMIIMTFKNLLSLVYYVNNNIYDDKFRYVFTSVARSYLFSMPDNKIFNILDSKDYFNNEIISLCKSIDIYLPLPLLVKEIIEKFKVYENLIILKDIKENIIRLDNLLDILNNLNDMGYNLLDFINYLEDISNFELQIKYSLNTSNEDAVKIMNIHKSKGLEFSLCYFTGMNNKFMIRDMSMKMIFDSKYGIIIPYINEGLENDIFIKDLYKEEYLKEEISEKIRLFYVALTRCREKMIILANIDDKNDKYSHLVPSSKRINYRSFLDILNSLDIINKYIANKESKYTDKYKFNSIKNITNSNGNKKINDKRINISYDIISDKHYSKEHKKLFNNEEIKKMEYGTKLHEMMEYADFYHPNNQYVINLLKKVSDKFINVYKEYEFIYDEDNIKYHGIIDLMLEYDDYINIIDYKLKNIQDEEYINQLKGYQKYISKISNKSVKIYLYSLINNILEEIK